VLYVATALANRDPELEKRVALHRERRPAGWGTLELGGGDLGLVFEEAKQWEAVLFDSVTLWVSARMLDGEDEEEILRDFEGFLEGAVSLPVSLVLVSDEVGLGIVPEGVEARSFRDLLGLVNQRAAAVAEDVRLCVAGIGVRIK
jgi:adenosylcobinamide kinase / adenosylcobinamide-phosphate guanylyltransferase